MEVYVCSCGIEYHNRHKLYRCNVCFKDTCDSCSKDVGFVVCGDCSTKYEKCCECREWHEKEELSYVGYMQKACDSCIQELYSTCESCDTRVRDTIATGGFGYNCLCSDCYDDMRMDQEEDEGEDCGGLHGYGYKPEPIFKKVGNEKERYFGVELEVSANRNYVVEGDDFVYYKEDCSIGGGFELVTHPFTYEWYKKYGRDRFEGLLDDFRRSGCTSYNAGTCGIHIHVSKDAVTSPQLYKMMKLLYENPSFTVIVSQRGSLDKLSRWAGVSENTGLRKKAKDKRGGDRYNAINLENDDTIEFRIFRGTLNWKSFQKNIEFVQALLVFCGSSSIKGITVKNFAEYVRRNRKRYKNLFSFLCAKAGIESGNFEGDRYYE